MIWSPRVAAVLLIAGGWVAFFSGEQTLGVVLLILAAIALLIGVPASREDPETVGWGGGGVVGIVARALRRVFD